MKITTRKSTYEKVMAKPRAKRHDPWKPSFLLATLIRIIGLLHLIPAGFRFTREGMEKIDKKQPVLILMNHSCFIDLEILYRVFYPRRFGIVCTNDAFVGKAWLMRWLGCIPTQKFVNDVTLIRDMEYLLKKKNSSVVMFPEASYSFDGTATALPRKMGVLLKKFGVPVVMVTTHGAFHREPLYNCLKRRKVQVTAEVKCLFTAEEIKSSTVAQLDAALDEAFGFDNFRWQQENGVVISEPFRADGLNRILYRCPHCGAEGKTAGEGTTITCHSCGIAYELTETGFLRCVNGEGKFDHIPDWYAWQRDELRRELEDGTYRLEADVDIGVMVDHSAVYMIGEGHLTHTAEGFHLTGCDGKLDYRQSPLANYSLYSDYYWYEIGDVICVGNNEISYYCFPKNCGDVVARTRQAAEELYKLKKRRPARKPVEV